MVTPVQATSEAAFIPQNQPRQEKTTLERTLSRIKVAIQFWRIAAILFAVVLIVSTITLFANNPIVTPLKCETRFQPPTSLSKDPKQPLPLLNEQSKPIEPSELLINLNVLYNLNLLGVDVFRI